MLAQINTGTISGINGIPVDVEISLRGGSFRFDLIGFGDVAVRESKERVASAIRQSGLRMPDGKVLVNLAPAEVRKEGSGFDVSIALGLLVASGQVRAHDLRRVSVHGELALDGKLKPVRGAVAMTVAARERGVETVIVPRENAREAALIRGVRVVGLESLAQLVRFLNGEFEPCNENTDQNDGGAQYQAVSTGRNMSEVWGQESAKRALLVAAAGGHNILMIGPPGCGKSMLAECFPRILPALEESEALEVIKIHSIAGLPIESLLAGVRPYRNPHHVISDVGLVGGGSSPRPGEISLAHRGVLFLDEFPEFRRTALESLRAPLETGAVSIVRAKGAVLFPARFQLIAAMNPCPCGRLGAQGMQCLCSLTSVQSYLKRLSQPILDRIDLHVELDAVPLDAMTGKARSGTDDQQLREQIVGARDIQHSRQGCLNSELSSKQVMEDTVLEPAALKLLEQAASKMGLSARSFVRILRVARSIADLADASRIATAHVAEALRFRNLERLQAYVAGR